jgi:hypothetical protein
MLSKLSDYSAVTGNRALSLLAENPDGWDAPDMLAHGFSIKLLNQLIRDGLVTARTKRVIRGERSIEIVHMKITDAGRQALADRPSIADPRPERRGGR